jgi:hypothetical protein
VGAEEALRVPGLVQRFYAGVPRDGLAAGAAAGADPRGRKRQNEEGRNQEANNRTPKKKLVIKREAQRNIGKNTGIKETPKDKHKMNSLFSLSPLSEEAVEGFGAVRKAFRGEVVAHEGLAARHAPKVVHVPRTETQENTCTLLDANKISSWKTQLDALTTNQLK